MNEESIAERIKEAKGVNLIIIGIGTHYDLDQHLEYLCNLTDEGKFIKSSKDPKHLFMAFETLRETMLYKKLNIGKL